jgi:hypothetical protein
MIYYLAHTTAFESLLEILKSNYLFAGSEINKSRMFGKNENYAQYVYFSLLGSANTLLDGPTLFFNSDVLYKRSFRYSLGWYSEKSLDKTIKIKSNNLFDSIEIDNVLEKIDLNNKKLNSFSSHEILLKKKINLKYLVAICCEKYLDELTIKYINEHYPHVKILNTIKVNSNDIN